MALTRRCSRCGVEKPLDAEHFHRSKRQSGGFHYRCKPCANAENKDKAYHRLPEYRTKNRSWKLLRRYGMTEEEREELLAEQNGCCACCGDPETPDRRLVVDHDHETGRVRGLLCVSCNRGVGWLRDDPELLRSAALYLERALDRAA